MPLIRRETAEGPVWVRPPFRPEDHTAPAEAIELFERWRGDAQDGGTILRSRDSPFANYVEVGRRQVGGSVSVTLLEVSREFALEVELVRNGFGGIAAVPPRRAYELASARDALRAAPVRREG